MTRTMILIAVLAVLILAVFGFKRPAHAGPVADWGGTFCRIDAVRGVAHVAKITCTNNLTSGVTNNEGSVSDQGLAIDLIATMQPGAVPDTFVVLPPEGFVAVPPQITVGEGQTGVVLIFALDGMVMG